jgi:hypothetical protein
LSGGVSSGGGVGASYSVLDDVTVTFGYVGGSQTFLLGDILNGTYKETPPIDASLVLTGLGYYL